jgi:uncharacterized protein YjlB
LTLADKRHNLQDNVKVMFLNIGAIIVATILITAESMDNLKRNIDEPGLSVVSHLLKDDGIFPNNADLPLLLYKNALRLPETSAAEKLEATFSGNGWGGMWRNGIYGFHHYHSTAHEVLGVYSGWADVQLGGPDGVSLRVEKNDVVIIPAGVAHKNLGQSSDFRVVGAYPPGQHWDMNYGKSGERPLADKNIASVPLPDKDPVYGDQGPVFDHWIER